MTVVELVNPLPRALAHYQAELIDLLGAVGTEVTVRGGVTSVERAGTDRSRAGLAWGLLRDRLLAPVPRGAHRLVVWPAIGFPELVLWRGGARRTTVVVHDPTPLRSQVGLDPRAVRATHAVARVRPLRRLVVHSTSALSAVRERGFDGAVLPHPILAPRPRPDRPEGRHRALVLGQHKDTRDVSGLVALAPLLRERGLEPAIVGRGWPTVPGWSVDARFVSEAEFRDELDRAALVVLPYTKVYQSGVAVQAAEASVPVVGGRDTNLGDLYGEAWPGLLEPTGPEPTTPDWIAAVDRVLDLSPGAAATEVGSYRTGALEAWRAWSASL